jgi:putative Ca2+/H+ antiporter (TMEM165/GDT1 family)
MMIDWKVFATTFVMLFVAEIGDKTQLAVISMTSKTQKPVTVFIASVAALAVVTVIGVTVGASLTAVLPRIWIKRVAAILFFVVGILVFLDVL